MTALTGAEGATACRSTQPTAIIAVTRQIQSRRRTGARRSILEVTGDSTGSVAIERPCLYLVATPIGNLADISLRAIETLRAADLILAEDTRTSLRLLDRYTIRRPLEAFHQHNESARAESLVRRMQEEAMALALISDAGTPLLSDPGFPLVRAALAVGLPVRAVPGASALLASLCVSGLPCDRFAFEGFLPARPAARRSALEALAGDTRTLVFYESTHRILASLADIEAIMGTQRPLVVAREITKLHETVYRGTVGEVRAAMTSDPHACRGELVLVLGGAPMQEDDGLPLRLLAALRGKLSARDAVEVVHVATGYPRNKLYALALAGGDNA